MVIIPRTGRTVHSPNQFHASILRLPEERWPGVVRRANFMALHPSHLTCQLYPFISFSPYVHKGRPLRILRSIELVRCCIML